MSVIENLSPNRKKLLSLLGINKDEDMPNSFFDIIVPFSQEITSAEKLYCSDYTISGNYKLPVCIKNVVGTDHDRYAGKTWFEAFIELDRGEENIEKLLDNSKYYFEDLKQSDLLSHSSDLGFIKKGSDYYIFSYAGGGNNRMIIMKIVYLALCSQKKESEIEALDNIFSFYGNVRVLPSNLILLTEIENIIVNNWRENYLIHNISNNPDKRIYDLLKGPFLDRKIIAKSLTEEELTDKLISIRESLGETKDNKTPKL